MTHADLKHALAERFRTDGLGYTGAKTAFVRETLAIAERWAAATGWNAATQASP